jgi:hypothetical protein
MRCSFQDRTGRRGQASNKETFMFEEGVCVVCMVSRRQKIKSFYHSRISTVEEKY